MNCSLPVPSLYIDLFEKVKALGFSCVSFYVDWALLEGAPGHYYDKGIFDLQPFFDAAKEAGIYLLARPGPYINAEVSGGGFPAWLQRLNATVRTRDPEYWNATMLYSHEINKLIARNQITEGGPVILYQPENEYTYSFFDPQYMQDIMDVARQDGIVVPFISNDMSPQGHDAPGSGVGAVDIYGHDSYPLGFDCAHPTNWGNGFPTSFYSTHMKQSPSTPFSLVEFQGGSYDPWGGPSFANCAVYTNEEFVRVWYKNNIASGVNLLNIYMIFGGTNWGNLGYPQGYTSYDYGAAISEDRGLTRAKYSELKLLGNFMKVTPSYLDSTPSKLSTSIANTDAIAVTPLVSRSSDTRLWVVRHSSAPSTSKTDYKLTLSTSQGDITVPASGGTLSLFGRDSKIAVTDYAIGDTNLLYSTSDILTWKAHDGSKVVVLYAETGEHNEVAVAFTGSTPGVSTDGSSVKTKTLGKKVVVAWDAASSRQVAKVGDLTLLLLDRQSAYDYWVPQVSRRKTKSLYSSEQTSQDSVIVKAGYLVRSATLKSDRLELAADFNATTDIEVIGVPSGVKKLALNGKTVKHKVDKHGIWHASYAYKSKKVDIPDLKSLKWSYLDSLPEIQASHDDSKWREANLTATKNNQHPLKTPVSLYGPDYGYNTGYLLFRGHFTANGKESQLQLHTQGGSKYASSAWINSTLLGAWQGNGDGTETFKLPSLKAGENYVFTVIVENNGIEEAGVKTGGFKDPRGIIDYALAGHEQKDISWKLTGNLRGEQHADRYRGPLNEGGLFAERHGFHLPNPPVHDKKLGWKSGSPFDGVSSSGVAFYTAPLKLYLPKGYDIPLSFKFSEPPGTHYRLQLYVNGFQYGKYAPSLGPQTTFPVPEGVLDYRGTNWISVAIWAYAEGGAKLSDLELVSGTPIASPLEVKALKPPHWEKRKDAY
ncbi:hypothetical protein KEM52_002957 [Ascosphaera acerosa]|nr:hypothetical protein KEM52_002957 [Ascosphaera acerosa]